MKYLLQYKKNGKRPLGDGTAIKEVCLTEGRGGLGEIHAHAVRQEDLITDLEQVVSWLYSACLYNIKIKSGMESTCHHH